MSLENILKLKIITSPQNWEVIQHKGGFAEFDVCGIFEENTNDDTYQEIAFSKDSLYARVVCENDGSLAIPPVKLSFDDSEWHAHIEKLPCGGPYTLDIVLCRTDVCESQPVRGENIRHFCVGDVYLIAGQSNASGMGRGSLVDEPEIGVHVLRNMEFWDLATAPFDEFDYSKHNMFLSFAKKIKKIAGIPVGLIPAAMGGSLLSRWIAAEDGDLYFKTKKTLEDKKINFKAVLWYQGCGDAGIGESCESYLKRFGKVVNRFRSDFTFDDLPFFTFQLNRLIRRNVNERLDRSYDEIREAQRLAAHNIPNVYVLPAIDAVHMSDFIHISKASAVMLGDRLASQVLSVLYGKGLPVKAPEIRSAVIENERKIVVEFDNVTSFLHDFTSSFDEYPLVIEDANGKQAVEEVVINCNTVELYTKNELKEPVYISGQSGANPGCVMIDFDNCIAMLSFYRFKAEGNN